MDTAALFEEACSATRAIVESRKRKTNPSSIAYKMLEGEIARGDAPTNYENLTSKQKARARMQHPRGFGGARIGKETQRKDAQAQEAAKQSAEHGGSAGNGRS